MIVPCTYECDSLNEEILFIQQECDLMQYTGIKDKNGKEIYEGDIVRCNSGFYEGGVGVITYVSADNEPGFFIVFANYETEVDFNNIEVIGNIYENPELIKG